MSDGCEENESPFPRDVISEGEHSEKFLRVGVLSCQRASPAYLEFGGGGLRDVIRLFWWIGGTERSGRAQRGADANNGSHARPLSGRRQGHAMRRRVCQCSQRVLKTNASHFAPFRGRRWTSSRRDPSSWPSWRTSRRQQ